MLGNLGTTEIILIGIALVAIFGANKLSGLGRSLGQSSKELKKTKEELTKAMSGETGTSTSAQEVDKKIDEEKKEGEEV